VLCIRDSARATPSDRPIAAGRRRFAAEDTARCAGPNNAV
jgi:hypothetical protein